MTFLALCDTSLPLTQTKNLVLNRIQAIATSHTKTHPEKHTHFALTVLKS